ncbi:nucleotidyl transferase AbiEii/AbiGii toxin family protein [Candidatus Woesearchaeota archaeon]|nr:nucleotidyl transferase AbiEii/AbiGii toxin family protein [Candidatus Woesearchaeota archaeon]
MGTLIDHRELMERARKLNLPLGIVEKDYVLGWALYGISRHLKELVFKGGTALSKLYFPEIWRLSEDLDFNLGEEAGFDKIIEILENQILPFLEKESGIKFQVKSKFSNPTYLQVKIQYLAVLGFKNFIKIDISRYKTVEKPVFRKIKLIYSDYPEFEVKVKTLDEIFAAKVKTILERTRCRDFFDLWKLLEYVDISKIKKLILLKCEKDQIDFQKLFKKSKELEDYWQREMPRLIDPVPDLDIVLEELRKRLNES